MKFDLFLSICQTEVDGYLPSEAKMFQNFFNQVELADQLSYGTAWVAETHLSCQIQKENRNAVIPNFKGEIGLNTDILQLASLIFSKTKKINVGSAIRNIICNGGPIAHAEMIRTFLFLQTYSAQPDRILNVGYAAGRFPFSNTAFGFYPKTALEKKFWEPIKNKYFSQGSEIFLRFLTGEKLSSQDLSPTFLRRTDFRDPEDFQKALSLCDLTHESGASQPQFNHFLDQSSPQTSIGFPREEYILLNPHWSFEKVGLIPQDVSLKNLKLTIGSHDPLIQNEANRFLPVGVFNLSITPESVIDETHIRMRQKFHPHGGAWKREYMPRTVMLYLNDDTAVSDAENSSRAQQKAQRAWENYWTAMEKTLDPEKVKKAVSNTVAGNPAQVLELLKLKYHRDDQLMLWFDFNLHDNEEIRKSMICFENKIAPFL